MKLSSLLGLRRVFFSNYHPFEKPPKPAKWVLRERLKRFNAVSFLKLIAYVLILVAIRHGTN